jgi:hypothetical protein
MDGTSRTCLNCQAELKPNARFCPKCGQQQSGLTAPAALSPRYSPQQPFQQAPQDTVSYTPPAPAYPSAPAPYPPSPAPYQPQPWGQPATPPRGGRQEFESFQPGQPPVPPGAAFPPGPPRQPPRRHDGNRSRSSMALLILVPLLVIGIVAVLVVARPFSHPKPSSAASNAARTTPASTASAGSASPAGGSTGSAPASLAASGSASPSPPSSPAVTEQQAASSVATMLGQSVSDRSAIVSASNDVAACGPDLASDQAVFDKAASSRQKLLTKLSQLPGNAALPPALISDLTKAWQASIAADQGYAQWATDETAKACVPNDTGDPGYLATDTPNQNATTYKTAFAAQWNPIAAQYGLTQYQQNQL